MFLINLARILAAFWQQELSSWVQPEQPLEYWLAQLELQREIKSDYYHACGRW